jgi:hypothetical protein
VPRQACSDLREANISTIEQYLPDYSPVLISLRPFNADLFTKDFIRKTLS